jgi:hypothetical protein
MHMHEFIDAKAYGIVIIACFIHISYLFIIRRFRERVTVRLSVCLQYTSIEGRYTILCKIFCISNPFDVFPADANAGSNARIDTR